MDVETCNAQKPHHRRNASSKSNILRALVSSSKTRPDEPISPAMPAPPSQQQQQKIGHSRTKSVPFLPSDHPHAPRPKALGERQGNVQSPPPSPSKRPTARGMRVPTKTQDGSKAPKKSKSSSSLGAMFARMNRSSKDLLATATTQLEKNKENETPSATSTGSAETPIWAQFASASANAVQPSSRPTTSDSKSSGYVRDEIAKYTPQEYSPSKQRNFNSAYEEQPSLRPRPGSRPQSTLLYSEGLVGAIGRRVSGARASLESRRSEDSGRRASGDKTGLLGRRVSSDRKISGSSIEPGPVKDMLNIAKRGGRVMAAVAAFQGKNKPEQVVLDPQSVDEAFEAVLDSRNIPEPMRQKMRSLTLRVKQDFIKQEHGSKALASCPTGTLDAAASNFKATTESDGQPTAENDGKSTKRSRGRTFTFSKGDKPSGDSSPSKKPRSQSKSRPVSLHTPKETSTNPPATTLTTSIGSFGRKSAPLAIPVDYIAYLRKNQDPTKIEVGRLHKLRILLRNETVAWVDSFVALGGMTEIVGSLHRTMGVEWREEHEDQLLHETLLCLKGLCTTDRAMVELEKVADELFPALLGMLFDEEKKGPAEYATRTVVINILFTFLASVHSPSPPEPLETRARRILTYLGEPAPKPDAVRPVDFVLDMHTPRPYRLWCREVSNVTREVFWIFLHHLNVVPLPKKKETLAVSVGGGEDARSEEDGGMVLNATFTQRHFPTSRPPVPAAPYIGGVEWDATTYITAHLDLLNGLLASLPSRQARNSLRQESQASGFEKVMGTTLRTCKEKFYSGVHDGLRAWVSAGVEDGWEVKTVREGPPREESPRKGSPKKGSANKEEAAPQLGALDIKIGGRDADEGEGWLG